VADVAQQAGTAAREQWIDAVKGVAICLMVFGHVLGGALGRGWLADGFRLLYDFIYTFHMPSFFIISGWLARASLDRGGPARYLRGRLGRLAYPYVLWGAIAVALLPFIAPFTSVGNYSFDAAAELRALLLGQKFWFLWALFVVSVLYLLLSPVPRMLAIPCVLLAYLFVAFGVRPTEFDGSLRIVTLYLIYFWAGTLLPSLDSGATPRMLAGDDVIYRIFFGIGALALCYATVAIGRHQNPLLVPALGLVGSAGLIALVSALPAAPAAIAATAGVASLEIFLLHPYFQGATREGLLRMGIASVPFLVLAQVTAGIIGPLIVARLVQRWRLGFLFTIRT